jgi:uncharacterized protein (TIGR04255 family)
MQDRDLPDFENPPAIETLLGLQFAPLRNWTIPHFGLFWERIRQEYPKVEVRPPSDAELDFKITGGRVKLISDAPVRCWFFHKSGKRLIQLQNNSFVQNWRKTGAEAPYLHYRHLRPSFKTTWQRLLSFIGRQGIEVPRVTQCEVTYVNHIDRGNGWTKIADLPNVICGWSGRVSGDFLVAPDNVAINAFYPIHDKLSGRLEIALQRGIREPEGTETLQLVLTARCKPSSSEITDVFEALDLCRRWVVKGFADFTTAQMHDIWGKRPRSRSRL